MGYLTIFCIIYDEHTVKVKQEKNLISVGHTSHLQRLVNGGLIASIVDSFMNSVLNSALASDIKS